MWESEHGLVALVLISTAHPHFKTNLGYSKCKGVSMGGQATLKVKMERQNAGLAVVWNEGFKTRISHLSEIKHRGQVGSVVRWIQVYLNSAPINRIDVEIWRSFQREAREYLTWKMGSCAYCGSGSGPFELEHITPKCRGGRNAPDNVTLACRSCNHAKDDRTAEEFGFSDVPTPMSEWETWPRYEARMKKWELYRRVRGELAIPVCQKWGGDTLINSERFEMRDNYAEMAACIGSLKEIGGRPGRTLKIVSIPDEGYLVHDRCNGKILAQVRLTDCSSILLL